MIFGQRDFTDADVGRTQERIIFAWLPRLLSNGQWVWLERVAQQRKIQREISSQLVGFLVIRWSPWRTYTLEQWAERAARKEVAA